MMKHAVSGLAIAVTALTAVLVISVAKTTHNAQASVSTHLTVVNTNYTPVMPETAADSEVSASVRIVEDQNIVRTSVVVE